MDCFVQSGKHARLSCEWIEHGLAFAPRSVHACCVLHHGDLGWPLLFEFQGGTFDIGRFLSARADLAAALNTDRALQCRSCPLLKNYPRDNGDFILRKVNLSHFTACNLHCTYCYLQKERCATAWWNDDQQVRYGHSPVDLLPVFRQFISSGFLSPQAEVFWGGGEPTLMPGFGDLLQLILEYGPWVTLTTNGTRFNHTLAKTPLANLTIICSVDAGTRETYRKLKQGDQYEAVWENLADYAAGGKTLVTKYILVPGNTDSGEIIAFLERSSRVGVHHVVLDVDAFHPVLTKEMQICIAFAREQARALGLKLDINGCGAINLTD